MEPLRQFSFCLKNQNSPTLKSDFESIFNLKEFLRIFEQTLQEQEVRFYKLFTSMTLFTRLVERAALKLNKEDQELADLLY